MRFSFKFEPFSAASHRRLINIPLDSNLRRNVNIPGSPCNRQVQRGQLEGRIMRKVGLKVVSCMAILLAAAAGMQSQSAQEIAIRAGRMFDSNSGQEMTRQVVIIKDERIVEVGPEGQVTIPQGARMIDLSQATILPGLIDGHSHIYDSLSNGQRVNTTAEAWTLLALKEAQLDLRAGFTTMRDCGTHGEGYGDVDVRNAINRGLFDGPRLQVSTRGS